MRYTWFHYIIGSYCHINQLMKDSLNWLERNLKNRWNRLWGLNIMNIKQGMINRFRIISRILGDIKGINQSINYTICSLGDMVDIYLLSLLHNYPNIIDILQGHLYPLFCIQKQLPQSHYWISEFLQHIHCINLNLNTLHILLRISHIFQQYLGKMIFYIQYMFPYFDNYYIQFDILHKIYLFHLRSMIFNIENILKFW